MRAEAERKEREGDFGRVGELRYGEIPGAEKNVKAAQEDLKRAQKDGALLPEVVDAEAIAKVVSRWTGIPASRLLETERERLLHTGGGRSSAPAPLARQLQRRPQLRLGLALPWIENHGVTGRSGLFVRSCARQR